MAWKKYDLTITVCVDVESVGDSINLDGICKSLAESRWSEGRYPFDDEMVATGLRGMLKRAIYDCLFQKYQAVYGNERQVTQCDSLSFSELVACVKSREAAACTSVIVNEKIEQCQMIERNDTDG